MIEDSHPFTQLAPNLAMGTSGEDKWRPLHEQPLLILVGVTGVGKSTTEAALLAQQPALTTLPNRRTLTDWLIIGALQQADGDVHQTGAGPRPRFAYTRRYRRRHPGGMAHALSNLLVDVTASRGLLLFDGLAAKTRSRMRRRFCRAPTFSCLTPPTSCEFAACFNARTLLTR